jgi:hypothetical protein
MISSCKSATKAAATSCAPPSTPRRSDQTMKTSTLATIGLLVFAPIAPQNLFADEQADKIKALEKRVEQLEKLLLEREAKPAPAGETPKPLEAPKPGPSLSSGRPGQLHPRRE